jgi:hypothetical protein
VNPAFPFCDVQMRSAKTMKEILNNRYDATRPRRISMAKMISRLRNISLMTEKKLKKPFLLGRTNKDCEFRTLWRFFPHRSSCCSNLRAGHLRLSS